MKAICTLAISILITTALFAGENPTGKSLPAQTAGLSGMILDQISGEALGGVEISIKGTDHHFYTDFDGRFEISEIEPGTYDLIVTYISYEKSLIENVALDPGKDKKLDIRLITAH